MVTEGLPPICTLCNFSPGRARRHDGGAFQVLEAPWQVLLSVWGPQGRLGLTDDSTPGGESSPIRRADTWQGSGFLDRMAGRCPEARAVQAGHRMRGRLCASWASARARSEQQLPQIRRGRRLLRGLERRGSPHPGRVPSPSKGPRGGVAHLSSETPHVGPPGEGVGAAGREKRQRRRGGRERERGGGRRGAEQPSGPRSSPKPRRGRAESRGRNKGDLWCPDRDR